MTIKEITALRKTGLLQEALQAAEAEFKTSPNKYTAGALFWCLNDLYKQQDKENALLSIERMKALYEEYGVGDELMLKVLTISQKRTIPYYYEINDALSRAKVGENISASYSDIVQAYNSSSLDQSLFPDFGWMIYYVLKTTPLNNGYKRKLLLHQYLKLTLPKPSLLHSRILSEAIKTKQTTSVQFRFRDFVRIWGLENLMEDDWKQFKTEAGHTLLSLVEKLIGVYAKEIKTDGFVAPTEFNELVDKALTIFPFNQNMAYFKAIVLISQGKKDGAIEHYKNLILKFPSKFYLWSQLAELVEQNDLKIGLLCKALTLGEDESFLGGVRLRLTTLLIDGGYMDNAKYELDKYSEVYKSKGWNLNSTYWDLIGQLQNIVAATTNQSLYREYSTKGEEFIYTSLPSLIAIKLSEKLLEDRNHPGKKFGQWTLRTKDGVLRLKKPGKYGLKHRYKNGAVFEVKILENRIVWIQPSQENPLLQDWIKRAEGTIKIRIDRKGNKYSIIKEVYINEKLLTGINDRDNVKVIAIRQEDGRWSAISLAKT